VAVAYFFDSSALVQRYVIETGTGWVRRLTRHNPSTVIYIAHITAVEVTCALARRRKGKLLTAAKASLLLRRFRQHLAGRYVVIEVTSRMPRGLEIRTRCVRTTPCSLPWRSKSTAAIRWAAPAPLRSSPATAPSTTPPPPRAYRSMIRTFIPDRLDSGGVGGIR
jgi:hypothetical protein